MGRTRKRKLTKYGRKVAERLLEKKMTLEELAEAVERRTGKFTDSFYLYGHLCGVPTPRDRVKAVREILEMHEQEVKQ